MTKLSSAHISGRSCSSYEIDIEDKLRVKLHRQDFIDKILIPVLRSFGSQNYFLFSQNKIYIRQHKHNKIKEQEGAGLALTSLFLLFPEKWGPQVWHGPRNRSLSCGPGLGLWQHIIYSYALWGEFKQCQWWSSIPPIFKKKIITCPLNRTNCTQKRPWHMMLEIQILAWYRHKNVAVLNRLMGYQHYLTSHYPLANWISNGNTYINMQKKNMHRFASTQKDHGTCGILPYITKMNDNMTRPRAQAQGK